MHDGVNMMSSGLQPGYVIAVSRSSIVVSLAAGAAAFVFNIEVWPAPCYLSIYIYNLYSASYIYVRKAIALRSRFEIICVYVYNNNI